MKRYLLLIVTILLVAPLLVKAEDPDIIYYDDDYIEYTDPIPVVEAPEELDIPTGDDETLTCDVDHFKKCLNNKDFYERLYDNGKGYICEKAVKITNQFFIMWLLSIISIILLIALVLALLKIRSLNKKYKTKK